MGAVVEVQVWWIAEAGYRRTGSTDRFNVSFNVIFNVWETSTKTSDEFIAPCKGFNKSFPEFAFSHAYASAVEGIMLSLV